MGQIASYRILRGPDLALSVRGAENGWNLLHSSQNAASVTASPAALLLTPSQAQAIPPLLANVGPAPKFTSLFDPLHDTLLSAFAANDFDAMDKTATEFLQNHPIASAQGFGTLERRIHQFFTYKGTSSSVAERIALIENMTVQERAAWNKAAHSRIDLVKAQTLATAVSGIRLPRGVDLIGNLRADLAFATLEACHTAMSLRDKPQGFANAYVSHVLELKPFLPHYVFELEVCKQRGVHGPAPSGILGQRLERLRTYETAINAALAVQGRAAGTPGHTEDCCCKCGDEKCVPIDPCCGEVNFYLTELLTLKDKTWCYKPSDIAYIENVAPYETRIRTHGFTRTVVDISENETTTNREEQRDHQVTDRFSLQSEMTKNLKASLNVDAKLHYGKADAGYSFDLHTDGHMSKETAYREAREQVREQVDHATLKMQVQTRSLRTRSVTNEQTETNKHKFKNTTAIAAVSKYFWVTQEKRGQLFSHGKRLHIDMLIPSPAMLFRKLEEMKRKRGEPKGPPDKPTWPNLTPADITAENYQALATDHQISGYTAPPQTAPELTVGLTVTVGAGSGEVTIPEGYTATKMSITSQDIDKTGVLQNAIITLSFGGGSVSYAKSADGDASGTPIVNINCAVSGPATISSDHCKDGSFISVVIELTPDPVDLGPWQLSCHALITKKYEADLKEYKDDLADYEAALKAYDAEQEDKIKGRHPFAAEEIMRTELKRSAIFMMCGEFNWPDVMNMDSELCHFPWPNRVKADKATSEWYFFDRAFDWNLASFIFYDYFRNPLCKWVDTFDPDEPNFLFKAFLRAGYSRVMLPVAPGMEDAVLDYLKTGGLWSNGELWPISPGDPAWISVIDEIKHSHDCYQQDRAGHLEALPDSLGQFSSLVRVFTDRYWKISNNSNGGAPDEDAMKLELNHQIFIDGGEYRIVSLIADPTSAPFDSTTPNKMSWIMGLDRKIEFAPHIDPSASPPLIKPYNWAVGPEYIGAPFHFDLPTDLIWIGDQGNACLPRYPIDCVCEVEVTPTKVPDGE